MCWLLLFLLLWLFMVSLTYVLFYYEAANGTHLEVLRARGKVWVLLLRGFLWSLYSHILMVVTAITGLHRKFYHLPTGTAERTPIIFIHGLYHNHTAWYFYLRWFRRWGWEHSTAMNLRGKFRSIQNYVQVLTEEVERVLADTGSAQVDLVGHSMGGLVIRSYLTNDSAKASVRRVVTLGSPHHGSKFTVFGVGAATEEMRPGSSFLEKLNKAEIKLSEAGRFYSIYSIVDNMVLPNDSPKLAGDRVKNIETRVVSHVGLVFCKQTASLVRQCLEEE